jgi:tripartite-type tricarboxylate transporter receptor subunit TctC
MHVEGTHVPYIGEAAGVRALLIGEIGIMTLTAGTAGPLVKDGRVFPLAIYAASRDERFSQVPTIVETTGDTTLALPGWLALVAKSGTPAPVTKLLREVTAKCARSDPLYRLQLAHVNASPVDSAASDVPTWLRRYTGQFKPLIEQLQIAE